MRAYDPDGFLTCPVSIRSILFVFSLRNYSSMLQEAVFTQAHGNTNSSYYLAKLIFFSIPSNIF